MMPLQPIPGPGRRGMLHASGNEKRERLLTTIRREPGLTFRGVCRASGVQTGTAVHHLGSLRGRGLVVAFAHGQTTRYFPSGWTPEAAGVRVVEAQPRMRHVLATLGSERLPQTVILDRAGLPRSTTQNVLRRLVQAGAVRVTRQGRLLLYEVA